MFVTPLLRVSAVWLLLIQAVAGDPVQQAAQEVLGSSALQLRHPAKPGGLHFCHFFSESCAEMVIKVITDKTTLFPFLSCIHPNECIHSC